MKVTKSKYGGNKKDQVLPIKRKFDDKRLKRKVSASIMTYWGVGTHFYANIREEENPAIVTDDDGELIYQICWDDKEIEIRGISDHSHQCSTWNEAREWIDNSFKKYFSSKTHKLELEESAKSMKWFYDNG